MTNRNSSLLRRAAMCGVAAFALASCADNDVSLGTDPDAGPPGVAYSLVNDMLPAEVVAVDLLFVIDNSGSMAEEQASLAAWAQDSLFGVLELDPETPLDLHVAVVSTDMGAGPYGVPTCGNDNGDGGLMNREPADASCSPPSDAYIVDVADGTGGRITNYTGSLDDTFSCIARIGTAGCGFEQPLQAMKRALDGSNAQNDGFLRQDALLAVVIVSDEDDCSAADTTVFDPGGDPTALGPMSSFRCFEHGVVCDGDDPRTPGAKTGCAVRDDSAYIEGLTGYADFLKGLKDDDSMVVVAGIFGDPAAVNVVTNDSGEPTLGPACDSPMGVAYPAVRLAAFLDMFPERNRFASICDADMGGPLNAAALRISDTATRSPCLHGPIRDAKPEVDGMQPTCVVAEIVDGQRSSLPACDGSAGQGTCFTIAPAPDACGHTETGLAVSVTGQTAPAGRTVVECVTD